MGWWLDAIPSRKLHILNAALAQLADLVLGFGHPASLPALSGRCYLS